MKAVFKFNGGLGAELCASCFTILHTGIDFTELEWQAARGEINLPPKFCSECAEKYTPIELCQRAEKNSK